MSKKAANKGKQPLRVVPIISLANIKTEPIDNDCVEVPDCNNNNNNNEFVEEICIKTEKPDEDDDASVIFVPTPRVVIKLNESLPQPPQKRAKLNNGNEKTKTPNQSVTIKKEPSSPKRRARNPISNSRTDSSKSRYDSSKSRYDSSKSRYDSKPYRSQSRSSNYDFSRHRTMLKKEDEIVSGRIFKSIQPSNFEIGCMKREFKHEIENLLSLLWFKAEQERYQKYVNRLIVGKIMLTNHRISTNQIFQTMRRDMVEFIQNYQRRFQKTPRYYNAFVDGAIIVVMCADSFAYDCLCEYINFKYQVAGNRIVNIEFLPSYVGRTLYCYAATVDDKILDTPLFLNQIQHHCTDLNANNWIIVRKKIHDHDSYTSIIFFMDETSSLTIDYVYNRKLFVCMLAVKFYYCGVVNME